jgi:hypothetical protein
MFGDNYESKRAFDQTSAVDRQTWTCRIVIYVCRGYEPHNERGYQMHGRTWLEATINRVCACITYVFVTLPRSFYVLLSRPSLMLQIYPCPLESMRLKLELPRVASLPREAVAFEIWRSN